MKSQFLSRCLLVQVAAATMLIPLPVHAQNNAAQQLRLLQPGDEWDYSLSGSGVAGDQEFPITGGIVIKVENLDLNGQPTLALTNSTTLRIAGHPTPPLAEEIQYIKQDPKSHSLHLLADNKGPNHRARMVHEETAVYMKGSWTPDLAMSDKITFADGSVTEMTDQAQGIESVETPAGKFQAIKVVDTMTNTPTGDAQDQGTIVTTNWIVASLGQPVRLVTKIPTAGGTYLVIHAVLTSTNVMNDQPGKP